MAKGSKKLEALKQRASNAARRARATREKRLTQMSAVGGAFLVGKLDQSGYLERIPSLGPLPPMATLGAALLLGETFVGGKAGSVMEGAGLGLVCVAAHQFGRGDSISGGDVAGDPLYPRSLPVAGPDDLDDLDDLEEEVAGLEDDAMRELNEALAAQDA